jgi:hypothetical protein
MRARCSTAKTRKTARHLFVSAVCAALAVGDRAQAHRIAQRYFPSLSSRERASLLVRLAVSHALEGR